MISVSDIHRSFGRNHVLRGVTFELPQSAMAGLIGPSGGGKSILMKIIAGIVAPGSGSISLPPGASVALMFQEGALFDSMNVLDNVAFPLVRGRVPVNLLPRGERSSVEDKVAEILNRVGLLQAARKVPAQLSGGMRRRVSLARALVSRPDIVLLDDPTCGLDPVASSVIMELITELHAEYKPTMLIISQDLRRLLPAVPMVYGLFGGIIAFSGSLQALCACESQQVRHFVACRFDMDSKNRALSHGSPQRPI